MCGQAEKVRGLPRTVLAFLICVAVVAGACGAPPATPSAAVPAPIAATSTPSAAQATPAPTAAQAASTPVAARATPTPAAGAAGGVLSTEEAATLASLEQVDDYPLYVMRYEGAYSRDLMSGEAPPAAGPSWGCSLFAVLAGAGGGLYGRNFDWDFSPALLLFTNPPDGYASVSMVGLAFLGFGSDRARQLTSLPPDERRALLGAPFLPFDGMNDQGLAIGMAAVPEGSVPPDPAKETIGSVGVIREMLDHAANVDEAVAIIQGYNVDMTGGPPIHYLIADRGGRAALVEYYQGEMRVLRNEQPWHVATNFLRSAAGSSTIGWCSRYDALEARLQETAGRLSRGEAMQLLSEVAQPSTQWSVVYDMSASEVDVAVGRQYEQVYGWRLE